MGPQTDPARTMGRSSLTIMGSSVDPSSYCSWNQLLPCHAPQPQEPEASDAICSCRRWEGGGRKETPFQTVAKVCHHIRSERKARLSRIRGGRTGCVGTPCSRSSIRLRKERSHQITLHAWFSDPISDSNWRRSQTFLSPHSTRRVRRR